MQTQSHIRSKVELHQWPSPRAVHVMDTAGENGAPRPFRFGDDDFEISQYVTPGCVGFRDTTFADHLLLSLVPLGRRICPGRLRLLVLSTL